MSDTVPVRIKGESGLGRSVLTLEVGGVNIAGLSRSVNLSASVDSITTVSVEMFAMNSFDVELPAAVTINVHPLEDGTIEETTISDTMKRYRFVRKADE